MWFFMYIEEMFKTIKLQMRGQRDLKRGKASSVLYLN